MDRTIVTVPEVFANAAAAPALRLLKAAGAGQGLTLVHFPAQLKRFPWDRGCS